MVVWTYNIVDSTIPASVNAAWFRGEIARAMRYIEKASAEVVRFMPSPYGKDGSRHINIGFDEGVEVGQQWSNKTAGGRVVHSVAFDPSEKWQSRWWHKMFSFRRDLYTVAIHELGHQLGLPHNTDGYESVMTPGARFSEFSPREIEYLQTMKP